MATLDDFFSEVLPEVDGCMKALARNAIRNAAIEFCRETLYVKYDMPPIDIVAGQHTYQLTAPSGSIIETLISVYDDGNPVRPKSADQLTIDWPNELSLIYSHGTIIQPEDWTLYKGGVAEIYHQPTASTIRLIGIPTLDKPGSLTVRSALRPSHDAMSVDDVLLHEWHEAIGRRAKSTLMAMPNQKWSNPELSVHYRAKFMGEDIPKAKGKALRSNIRDNQSVGRTRSYY